MTWALIIPASVWSWTCWTASRNWRPEFANWRNKFRCFTGGCSNGSQQIYHYSLNQTRSGSLDCFTHAEMVVTEKLIKAIMLDNGLELKLYDASRKVAGDRWRVGVVARIDIPVGDAQFSANDKSLVDLKSFKESFGEKARFEQKRERNFIDAKHKDDVLQSLIDSFLRSALVYLSHPDFPKKYVHRQYKEYLKRKTWYPR